MLIASVFKVLASKKRIKMTIATAIIENIPTSCNYGATSPTTLTQIPSFTAVSSCVIDHIVSLDSLTPSDKLYYLVNDFYQQSLKSWSGEHGKKHSAQLYSSNKIKFSASKIGALLGFSRSKIFNIQQKLESLGYLHINRSINQFGMNNVNVAATTLPKNIFLHLMFKAKNKFFSDVKDNYEVSSDQRRDLLTQTKQFIPLNFALFRFIFFNKNLSCNSKLLYIKLFSIIHKIKQKYNYPIYAGGIDTNTLLKDCNISRSTLFRSLKQLQENCLIACSKIRVGSESKSSNRFDKIINYIQMLIPKELEHVLVNNTPFNTDISSETVSNISSNDAALVEEATMSKEYPACVKRIPSILIKKNINIKTLDKEKIDKKEKTEKNGISQLNKTNKSISNFSNCSFSLKETALSPQIPEIKQNTIFEQKSLAEFYPLSSDDGAFLQRNSGRDFSLNAMNEILKSLASKLVNPMFYSKKSFMSYMTKILKHEMREPAKVNNAAFKILLNMSEEERKIYEIEKYLSQIENNREVTPEWHLKKKLACVLKAETAYELIKNYKAINIYGTKVIIELYRHVELTSLEKEILLAQVKATHERIGEKGVYVTIEDLELMMPKENKSEKEDKKNRISHMPIRAGIWGKIRTAIAKSLPDGEAIDANWFSKIEAEIDEQNKQITLKSKHDFIREYVFQRYQEIIDEAAVCYGLSFKGIYSEENPDEILTIWRNQNYA